MRKIRLLSVFIITFSISLVAQESDPGYLSKVQTLDSTLETLYGVISGGNYLNIFLSRTRS